MKETYQKPIVEIIKFEESEIRTDTSTMDFGIDDWFETGI